jgi:hypothetical protein
MINMTYSEALTLAKAGHKITRAGWNGKGMFVYYVEGSTFKVNRPPLLGIYKKGTTIKYRPHLDMKYADGSCGVWVASHSDMIECDWMLVQN